MEVISKYLNQIIDFICVLKALNYYHFQAKNENLVSLDLHSL